jgi:hypothetical protein
VHFVSLVVNLKLQIIYYVKLKDCSGILRFFCADRAESGTKAVATASFVLLTIY